jgi:Delta7-sterol 5-desaturase
LTTHSFAFYGLAFFGIILARYFLLAGSIYLFFHSATGQLEASLPTGSRLFSAVPSPRERSALRWKSIQKDIKLSIISSIVFALGAALVMVAYQAGITRLYVDIRHYPLWYLGVSYILAIILQDTYFYFLHRLLHHPRLFRWWHRGHHQSNHPTPWSSFAFDPLEAIAQLLFLVGIVFVVPLHFITMIALLSTMTVWGIVNHLEVDRLPTNFPHHWCARWFTGPAHHAIHHRHYEFHHGLYFTFWDRQLGTQAPKYKQEFINAAD